MPQASTLKAPRPQIPMAPQAESGGRVPAHAYAMLSDQGRVRHSNQDTCGASPECGAFLVCDGMGGAAAGEVASRLALEAFLVSLAAGSERAGRMPPQAASGQTTDDAGTRSASHPYERLREAVGAANQAVYRHSQKTRSLRGMGTTLVSILLDSGEPGGSGRRLWLGHVGDSRCYLLRAGELRQLTQDHSLVEEQIQAGLLTRVQASSSPIRNIITRAIGSMPMVEPEIAAHAIEPGDLYLLASDGLTRELEDAEIAEILTGSAVPSQAGLPDATDVILKRACHALVDAANASGGGDNITVVLVAVR